jgi:hypothetical protein
MIQFKLRKHASTTDVSIHSITLKNFNNYNISDKLKNSFNRITTYLCTDDVHNDNHNPVLIT